MKLIKYLLPLILLFVFLIMQSAQWATATPVVMAGALPVVNRTTTTQTDPGSVQSMGLGNNTTCMVTISGALKCWGIAVPSAGLDYSRGWAHVSMDEEDACALTTGGGVMCWGKNRFGGLGDGTQVQSSKPVQVVGLESGIAYVDAGYYHTCALTMDSAVKCWGDNSSGQLGNNSMSLSTTPVDVPGLEGGVALLAVGEAHNCVLMKAGDVKCWGLNNLGQLGNGDTTIAISPTPLNVAGLGSGIKTISSWQSWTCVLMVDGTVMCWGANAGAGLGDGKTASSAVPVNVFDITNAKEITVGRGHACALSTDGMVKCWGKNTLGQLADNTQINRLTPVPAQGLTGTVVALAAGGFHTCALMADKNLRCWGSNSDGQLNDGSPITKMVPASVPGLDNGIQAITAGLAHTCALSTAGTVKCWGNDARFQVDDPALYQIRQIEGLPDDTTALSAGENHTCALSASGGVSCWGYGSYGQIGDGNTTYSTTSASSVINLPGGAQSISGGGWHTCAITAVDGVKCWGYNNAGQLGNNSQVNTSIPLDVTGLDGLSVKTMAIAAGKDHSCALIMGGTVQCWGGNAYGQLGDGTNVNRLTPVTVPGLSGVTQLSSRYYFTCALNNEGVWCWGKNQSGQLGNGTYVDAPAPVLVQGLSDITALNTGGEHVCALNGSGALLCWGSSIYGQLGSGPYGSKSIPTAVLGLNTGVVAFASGVNHNCALVASSGPGYGVKCWGYNNMGQIGLTRTVFSVKPLDFIIGANPIFLPSVMR